LRAHLVVLLLLAGAPPLASAADEPPPNPAPVAEEPAGEEKKPDLAPKLDFDDLLPPEPAASPADARFERQVERRRKMLRFHQGLGIATWSALAATTIVGQLDFNDRFRGGGDTGEYHGAHRALAAGTSAMFLGTALLSLLAPEPYEKKTRFDTATVHKASMAVAAAGMAAQLALGLWARQGSAGTIRERDIATAHQITGYATLGAMTIGAAVLFF
jgi:hypothetical protein